MRQEPDCSQCENAIAVSDPYCTGDSWFVIYECRKAVCEKDQYGEQEEVEIEVDD